MHLTKSLARTILLGLLIVSIAFAQQSQTTFTQTVNKAAPTLTLAADSTTITYRGSVQLTASLQYQPDGVWTAATPATGTISFFDGGTLISGGTTTLVNGVATLTVPLLTGGVHTLTAQYSGDSNFESASSSVPVTETVIKYTPPISPATLATSKSPANYAESVTFSTQLPADSTGTVTFLNDGVPLGTANLAVVPADGAAEASITVSDLSVGSHNITAVYSGDGNYAGVTSDAIQQIINNADTLIQLAAKPNAANVGTNIKLSALVSTGGTALDPADSIAFSDGATSLQSVTISPVTTTNLAIHSDSFTDAAWKTYRATVAPDGVQGPTPNTVGNHLTVSDSTGYVYQTIDGLTPTEQYTFSVWMNLPAGSATVNIAVADTGFTPIAAQNCPVNTAWTRCSVTVTIPAGVASANIQIGYGLSSGSDLMVYGAQYEKASTVGPYVRTTTAAIAGQGAVATLDVNNLPAGVHTITAAFAGDTKLNASTDQVLVTLGKADSSSESITLTSSSPTAVYGTNIVYSAQVAPISGIMPTGTVTFKDGETILGTGTLSAGGIATFSIATLTGGDHQISATYEGDPNFTAITSAPLTQTITRAGVTLSVSSTGNPSTYGNTVVFTITATGTGAIPTGTISLDDGGVPLGTALTLDPSGKATFSTNSLKGGTHTIQVVYGGDQNYE